MITREERHAKIVNEIVDFSEIFETFALNGKPIFSDSIPTACICFNREGLPIGFVWGKKFFDECSDYKAKFILCHEMLHIFLRHGKRRHGLTNSAKANVCMDISINHLLIDEFGFIRSLIEGWEDVCWRDTVFNMAIPKLPTFENYYALDDSFFNKGFSSIDNHDFLDSENEKELSDELKDLLTGITKKLADKIPSCGDELSSLCNDVEIVKSKKPKFESLVKKIAATAVQKKKIKMSSWAKIDRRFCYSAPDIPPMDLLHERLCKAKYKCAFFIDNSGSCTEFLERFCKVAGSLDPKVFDVAVYSFDTAVSDVKTFNGKYRVHGGGGTCFECIGRKVEETNPDIVFVLTDGWASSFTPKDRKKYFWFLVEHSSQTAIKQAGTIYRLSQYE